MLTMVFLSACRSSYVSRGNDDSHKHLGSPHLNQRLDALIASYEPNAHIGVEIYSLVDHKILYAHNAQYYAHPASTLKLLTAAAALHELGPAYCWHTDLLADQVHVQSQSVHHLYLRGTGDPSLMQSHLRRMAISLRQQGIQHVLGDIIIDDSAFDAVPFGKGWMWDDLPEGYSAPVNAVSVANNQLSVHLLPGAHAGLPTRITYSPDTSYVQIINHVVTGAPSTATDIQVLVSGQLHGLLPTDTLTLSGVLSVDTPIWSKHLSVADGAMFAGHLLREALLAENIAVTGMVVRGLAPVDAINLSVHHSLPLGMMLNTFMKASNNHALECLTKTLGAQFTQGIGGWQNGLAAIQYFMREQVQLVDLPLNLADGSGSSRYNLLTPSQINTLLVYMDRDFHGGPEFIASLPISGVDGTLATRLTQPNLRGHIRAKTGTLTGVSNLAGYMDTPHHGRLAFTIMSNGFVGSSEPYRQLQEAILAELSMF